MTHRILILGLPGSGKTTLARKLAADTAIPHLEADRYFWRNGAENPAFLDEIAGLLRTDASWIYEGHYGRARSLLRPRITCLVWLDLPYRVTLLRWLLRSIRRRDFGDWRWVCLRARALRRSYAEACTACEAGHLPVFRLRSARDAEKLPAQLSLITRAN